MLAHWDRCAGDRNFGDQLTRALLERYGKPVSWAAPDEAELFGCGSIAESIPAGFAGTVIGAGYMWRKSRGDLTGANVLALRGKLTARAAQRPDVLLADLGLLAVDLIGRRSSRRRYSIGTVRHFVDRRPAMGVSIDPLAEPAQVVETAASCIRIVSSSLHGIVLADSLGLASMYDPHPGVLGAGFKFADYSSSFAGPPVVPYVWRYPDRAQVSAKQQALRELLEALSLTLEAL